jgi:lipoprotein signal peptidase
MQRYARLALVAVMLIAGVGCDQATKALARDQQGRGTASFFDDTVRLQYVENPGGIGNWIDGASGTKAA